METRKTVVVVGAKEVGKTALVYQFLFNSFNSLYVSTDEVFKRPTVINENKAYIVDLPGYENAKLSAVHTEEIKKADVVLLAFSVADQQSFNDLPEIVNEIRQYRECPILLVGNKTDLTSERNVSQAGAKEFAANNHLTYMEVSAKNKIDVVFERAFQKTHGYEEIRDVINKLKLEFRGVGESRVAMRDEAIDKCRAAKSIDDVVTILEDFREKAQLDHVKNSGFRFFGRWLFKEKSATAKKLDEVIDQYKEEVKM